MTARTKLIIAIVIFAIICIIMIVFALVQKNNDDTSNGNPKTTSYTDPYSGETITETEGKVDESYNNENSIVFFGFPRLLEYGMTQNQIEILKTYLLQYSLKRAALNENKFAEVTVDFKTYTQVVDQNTGEKTVTFDLIANRDETQRFYVVNKSPTISTMWTTIYASDKTTVVFDPETESYSDDL